ncbi:MAG: apolipoprotein N-acyltransferase [Magnetospirillum sp.]|nr:apolipoprotein N-acyltransferase [Magnetospirillum sp.]
MILPDRLGTLAGWRRRGALAGLGGLAALALPPVHLLPVLLLSLPGLVWILDGSRDRKAAFGAGWWFGAGWFSAGLYWISHALLTDPARFGWMIPFAVFGLSGVLAVFLGLATLATRLLAPKGPGRILVLAAAWTLADWLRSFVLTGFPWNPLGSVWDASTAVLQAGALFGVYGLTLLTVLAFAAPAVLADVLGRRAKAALLAAAAALPLAAFAGGSIRLAAASADMVPDVTLRLVQANVTQAHKWRDDLREANLDRHLELSRQAGWDRLTAVVWPETAAAFFLDVDAPRRARVAEAAPPGGLVLTGAPRVTPRGVEPLTVWNSLMAVDGAARVVAVYDKVHLVPFGEYVPLRAVLPIAKITHGGTDFSPGPGLRTLRLPGLPAASPLICYEAIFPHAVVGADQPRPGWLLNVTNDGWFGLSSGPHQHLAAARMRAVEEGLPLVRAANTGISAVIDGYGRVVAALPLGESGILDSLLPRAIPQTLYGWLGDALPIILAAVCFISGTALRRLK